MQHHPDPSSRRPYESFVEKPGSAIAGDAEVLFVAGVSAVWRARLFLIAGLLAGVALAFAVAAVAPVRYTVTMVVAPPVDIQPTANAGGRSLSSAVASLTGGSVNLTEEAPLYERFLLLLTSYPVVEAVDARHQLMRQIYSEAWDANTQSWREPQTIRWWIMGGVNAIARLPGWREPTLKDLTEAVSEKVRIHIVAKGPVRKVVMETPNPQFGANLMNWLYVEAMRVMREQTRQRLDAQMAMILANLARTQNAEHRTALVQMIVALQRDQMLIADEIPVGAVMLQPPTASTQPSWPRIDTLAIVFGTVGVLFGFATFLIVGVWKRWARK